MRYTLDINGKVNGCGINPNFEFEVDENTPFQSITESQFWKKVNDVWTKYDPTWIFDFPIRVIIPESKILDDDFLLGLISHVKSLIADGNAAEERREGERVLYFNALYSEHEDYLRNINIKIETNEEFI